MTREELYERLKNVQFALENIGQLQKAEEYGELCYQCKSTTKENPTPPNLQQFEREVIDNLPEKGILNYLKNEIRNYELEVHSYKQWKKRQDIIDKLLASD